MHTTKAYLPLDIARALSVDPSLIQKPVETFYTRDAVQLRVSIFDSPRYCSDDYSAGRPSHDAISSSLCCTYYCQVDKTSICPTCWTKILPSQNIRSFQGTRGQRRLALERHRYEVGKSRHSPLWNMSVDKDTDRLAVSK